MLDARCSNHCPEYAVIVFGLGDYQVGRRWNKVVVGFAMDQSNSTSWFWAVVNLIPAAVSMLLMLSAMWLRSWFLI